ncbi:MAG: hypothetical protein ABIP69_06380 [Ferruginibacter sp.]
MKEIIKKLQIEELPHPGEANTEAHVPVKSAERYPPQYSNLEHQEKHFSEEQTLDKSSEKKEDDK